jgi:short-subunit dehydrogenase
MTTALITGATSGIGAAFARLLAAKRFDLILVSRDVERLERTAVDLRRMHGVRVEVLPADLVEDHARSAVEARLADPDRPVDILINNAGVPTGASFLRTTVDVEERMLRLNVLAVLRLAKAVAPGMVERGRGVIINVSSTAGFVPNGTYSASKAWVTSFSEVLAGQLGPRGVRVVALCPGYVRTEFHQRASIKLGSLPDWVWLDADQVAADGWRGAQRQKVVVITDGRYRAAMAVVRHLPLRAVSAGLRLASRRGLSR